MLSPPPKTISGVRRPREVRLFFLFQTSKLLQAVLMAPHVVEFEYDRLPVRPAQRLYNNALIISNRVIDCSARWLFYCIE